MTAPTVPGCAIVGAGRLGTALSAALPAAGVTVDGPHGRGYDGGEHDIVLLCVPDAQIAAAAAAIIPRDGRLVGHTSGATPLGVLAPHEAFGLHPLMTVTHGTTSFTGCGCATAGTTDRARSAAHALAATLAMVPADIADEDRAAYHAAAAIASNFLVTLEDAAEQLLATTGASRDLLLPLVRATVENWGADGAERALTGPIARGDEGTVARHRETIAARTPELLGLFDVLAGHTRTLAARAGATTMPAGVA